MRLPTRCQSNLSAGRKNGRLSPNPSSEGQNFNAKNGVPLTPKATSTSQVEFGVENRCIKMVNTDPF